MALGFQDCCNGLNFFLINDIPATVSEFEVYNIETVEGPVFCAIYVNLPPLNYTPPTYNVITLTQQVDCETCLTITPCPTTETIFHSQFGEGSVITESNCTITTIKQLQVQCFPTSPTYYNSLDGSLDLFIKNGTPPYIISDYMTGQVINAPQTDDFFGVLKNISAGTYNFFVTDFIGDFGIPVSCVVTAPPPLPVFGCNTKDNTFYDKPDGVLNFVVLSAGTEPYRYYFGNSQFQFYPPINVTQGTYNIRYEDQYYVQYIQCKVGGPPEVLWPKNLCLTFDFCGTRFSLSFTRNFNPVKIDYRAWYLCDNPLQVGCERLILRYDENGYGGWIIEQEPIIFPIQFTVPCEIQLLNPFFSAFKSAPIDSDQPTGGWKINGTLASQGLLEKDACPLGLKLLSKENFTPVVGITNGKALLASDGGTLPITYTVEGKSFNYLTNNPLVENLKPGDYTAVAKDSRGLVSNTVSFTIEEVQAVDFYANFNPCVNSNYSTVWGEQVPGGSSTMIEGGDTLISVISSSSVFGFDFLPEDAILVGNIKIVVDLTTIVGPTGYTDPNIVSIVETTLNDMYIVTDGVTSYFMNGVCPSYSKFPLFTNGSWYKVNQGGVCCRDPLNEGVEYKKQIVWFSNQVTIKSNSTVTTLLINTIENLIPYSRYQLAGCPTNGSCSGYINVNVRVSIENLQVLSGSVILSQNYDEIYQYNFQSNSNGTTGWTPTGKPSPNC